MNGWRELGRSGDVEGTAVGIRSKVIGGKRASESEGKLCADGAVSLVFPGDLGYMRS